MFIVYRSKILEIYFTQTIYSHDAMWVSNQGDMYFYYLLILKAKLLYV